MMIFDPSELLCHDCGIEAWMFMEDGRIVHEDFYVSDELWHSVAPERDILLCIGCFETRLGRELRRADFKGQPHDLGGDPPSARFWRRWGTI